MSTLETLRIARGAQIRLGGTTKLGSGETWDTRVNYWIERAVAEGYTDSQILDAIKTTKRAEEEA